MLYLDLKTLMENRGIDKPVQFLVQSGFTYYTAHRLAGKMRMELNFRHLEKLCISLHCSIDDLIVWDPPKGMKDSDKHPLSRLKLKKRKGNITSDLRNLSPEKLDELREYIQKLQNPE